MEMTNADILRSWEEARDKKNQVKVLADLNCTTQEHIVLILKEAGVDGRLLPHKRKPAEKKAPPLTTAAEPAQVIPFPKETLQPKPRAVHEAERMRELFAVISEATMRGKTPAIEYVEEFNDLWVRNYYTDGRRAE